MAERIRRLSPQTLATLDVLMRAPEAWVYGLEIASATGLKSGSLYPILIRLDARELVESRWLAPEKEGRPARHAYRITPAGRSAFRAASTRVATTFTPKLEPS